MNLALIVANLLLSFLSCLVICSCFIGKHTGYEGSFSVYVCFCPLSVLQMSSPNVWLKFSLLQRYYGNKSSWCLMLINWSIFFYLYFCMLLKNLYISQCYQEMFLCYLLETSHFYLSHFYLQCSTKQDQISLPMNIQYFQWQSLVNKNISFPITLHH